MPHRTPEQHAKRINKAIDKKYPLIGKHFHTTPEEQAARLERLDASQEIARERIEDFDRMMYERAANDIYMLVEHLGEEEVNAIATEREKFEQQWGATQSPAYVADFWFNKLRRFTQGGI